MGQLSIHRTAKGSSASLFAMVGGCIALVALGCGSSARDERDGGVTRRDSAQSGALIPDGALISFAPLPSCRWPSMVLPPVPEGGIGTGSIARTQLVCLVPDTSKPEGYCSSDGGSCGEAWGPCVMACPASDYAVLTSNPSSDRRSPGSQPGPDADIVSPNLPAGCTGTLGTFNSLMAELESTEYPPSVRCCPCE
jgi:hypothetical protein